MTAPVASISSTTIWLLGSMGRKASTPSPSPVPKPVHLAHPVDAGGILGVVLRTRDEAVQGHCHGHVHLGHHSAPLVHPGQRGEDATAGHSDVSLVGQYHALRAAMWCGSPGSAPAPEKLICTRNARLLNANGLYPNEPSLLSFLKERGRSSALGLSWSSCCAFSDAFWVNASEAWGS